MAKERERRQRAARQAEQREQRRERQHAKRRLRRWLYLGASGVIAILITISLFLPSMTRNTGTNTSSVQGEIFAILPATPILEGTTYDQYNSIPPTSGPRWETPAPWGVSTTPVPNERQVRNLEHGGILIQYKSEDAALISQLVKFAERQVSYPCYLLVAPYPDPNMPAPIAATAWGVRDLMQTYDEARLKACVDAYKNKGPEQVDCNPSNP
ncbi:MAG: DUF3105 domain-containing protein [Chloroflexota bacterium]